MVGEELRPDHVDSMPLAVLRESSGTAASAERAVWATIWLVAQLPGMTESYERLLEYGQMVSYGVPPRAAAVLLLEILEPPTARSTPAP